MLLVELLTIKKGEHNVNLPTNKLVRMTQFEDIDKYSIPDLFYR